MSDALRQAIALLALVFVVPTMVIIAVQAMLED